MRVRVTWLHEGRTGGEAPGPDEDAGRVLASEHPGRAGVPPSLTVN